MDARKFLVMSVTTAGLYLLFWFWKNWRWARIHGKEDVSPFWRTVFSACGFGLLLLTLIAVGSLGA
ncbi:hypothetical protein LRS10_09140 [Phenylobacterium sp. J426]|uniref:hypothetical protein n=1 Tax=Phenylobacterium sp. J426 TaxID=2898439 RepID=UPI00215194F6|nr:hypothetical protein [Phenylobacterium sp. J426]MCR5874312.1 hypothetical protein [Phenylobacterium sp. J426]